MRSCSTFSVDDVLVRRTVLGDCLFAGHISLVLHPVTPSGRVTALLYVPLPSTAREGLPEANPETVALATLPGRRERRDKGFSVVQMVDW